MADRNSIIDKIKALLAKIGERRDRSRDAGGARQGRRPCRTPTT
jgi:hypothetical protein